MCWVRIMISKNWEYLLRNLSSKAVMAYMIESLFELIDVAQTPWSMTSPVKITYAISLKKII